MIQVDISDHPEYPFFKRRVIALAISVPLDLSADENIANKYTAGDAVVLYTLLQYFQDDGVTPADIVPPKPYPLKADKSTWVNQLGEIVPELIDGEPNPEAFMNQYDFFMMLIETKQPVVFDTLIRKHITDADELFQRYDS